MSVTPLKRVVEHFLYEGRAKSSWEWDEGA